MDVYHHTHMRAHTKPALITHHAKLLAGHGRGIVKITGGTNIQIFKYSNVSPCRVFLSAL